MQIYMQYQPFDPRSMCQESGGGIIGIRHQTQETPYDVIVRYIHHATWFHHKQLHT